MGGDTGRGWPVHVDGYFPTSENLTVHTPVAPAACGVSFWGSVKTTLPMPQIVGHAPRRAVLRGD